MRTTSQRVARALELVRDAEDQLVVTGLGHVEVALKRGVTQDDPTLAAREARRRLDAVLDYQQCIPCDHAKRCLREAQQVLLATEVSA